MGLLLPHKRTLTVYRDMLTVSKGAGGDRVGGGERGEIKVFSAESRYRLFRLIHQLRFDKVTFCTLTYPADFPTDKKVYKAHLKEYRRRFERLYGKVAAVWRLEFQERGAPHYHIMYLDAPHIPILEWCRLWSDVIRTDDENHRKIGVDVKLVTGSSEKGLIASYLGKYVAKVDTTTTSETDRKPGRWWGKWNVEEPEPYVIPITDNEADLLVERLLLERNNDSWAPPDYSICTLFGENLGTDAFRRRVVEVTIQVTELERRLKPPSKITAY